MSFADMVAADVAAIATPDEFGETITYRPHGGVAKDVSAIVARTPLVPNEAGQKQSQQRVFQITIPKGANGIELITKGKDMVDVRPTRSADPAEMRVVEVLAEGAGSWRIKAVA